MVRDVTTKGAKNNDRNGSPQDLLPNEMNDTQYSVSPRADINLGDTL